MSAYCKVSFYSDTGTGKSPESSPALSSGSAHSGPCAKTVRVPAGTTLVAAAQKAGIHIEAQCNGTGTCGKCRVRAKGALSPVEKREAKTLKQESGEGVRLGCMASVQGDVTVYYRENRDFSIVESGRSISLATDPVLRLVELSGDALMAADSGSREDRGSNLSYWHQAFGALEPASADAARLLGRVAEVGTRGGRAFGVVRDNRVIDITDQDTCLGIALDIGTTSMVAELVDLVSSASLDTASMLNPQVAFGGDVLTRITYAADHEDGIATLQKRVAEGINQLIERLCRRCNCRPDQVYEMSVAANTTMLHMLMGVDPGSMAQAPYHPVFTDMVHATPRSMGLNMAENGRVTLLPSASPFVGADIVAGIMAAGFDRETGAALFIDIGTNGEMVINHGGKLVGSSSAAGPALEGMNISCGTRAETGAIERVSIEGDGELVIATIGNAPPMGLCGSGLVDMMACLVQTGVVAPSGRFAKRERLPEKLAQRLIERDNKPVFLIDEASNLTLTQKDIRQVQLAKGAVAAGVTLLLRELNLTPQDIDQVFIAGAFGAHLKPESLLAIGLLPPEFDNKIRFVGNTAKEGAKALLLDRSKFSAATALCDGIRIKELSFIPEFQDCFVQCLGFPKPTN